jgi:hypothetical protein
LLAFSNRQGNLCYKPKKLRTSFSIIYMRPLSLHVKLVKIKTKDKKSKLIVWANFKANIQDYVLIIDGEKFDFTSHDGKIKLKYFLKLKTKNFFRNSFFQLTFNEFF